MYQRVGSEIAVNDDFKIQFRNLMLDVMGFEGTYTPPPKYETKTPAEVKAKPVAKMKARTWVAPRRTRNDHKPAREPNDFAGRTSAPFIYYDAREVDTMWQPGRRTGPNA